MYVVQSWKKILLLSGGVAVDKMDTEGGSGDGQHGGEYKYKRPVSKDTKNGAHNPIYIISEYN